jgi:hypothetical protein
MENLLLPEQLVQKLQDIARRENRPVEAVVASMVENYEPQNDDTDPIDAIVGVFDDDITDLSTTVRETIQEYFRRKAHDSSS